MILYTLVALGAAALLVLADQVSKLYITNHFALGEVKEFITVFSHRIISLTHVRNSGAAWSMFEGKTVVLVVFPIAIIAALVALMLLGKFSSKVEYASASLIIAGGVGNLIDRLRLHEVVDFILWEPFKFPVFNIADICVVSGAVLLTVYILFFCRDAQKADVQQTGEENRDAK